MHDSLTFRLPDSAQPVRPVLRVVQDIKFKDYILTVTFRGSDAIVGREDVPTGLMWSTSLERPFVYLPEADAPAYLRLTEFTPPNGALAATLSIAPWASTDSEVDSHFSGMVLETVVINRPTVIVGKEA